jgi:hypothetical protein
MRSLLETVQCLDARMCDQSYSDVATALLAKVSELCRKACKEKDLFAELSARYRAKSAGNNATSRLQSPPGVGSFYSCPRNTALSSSSTHPSSSELHRLFRHCEGEDNEEMPSTSETALAPTEPAAAAAAAAPLTTPEMEINVFASPQGTFLWPSPMPNPFQDDFRIRSEVDRR